MAASGSVADWTIGGRRRLTCPTLVLWSTRDDMEVLDGDALAALGDGPGGGPVDSGHHLAEEAPGPLAARLGNCSPPGAAGAGEGVARRVTCVGWSCRFTARAPLTRK